MDFPLNAFTNLVMMKLKSYFHPLWRTCNNVANRFIFQTECTISSNSVFTYWLLFAIKIIIIQIKCWFLLNLWPKWHNSVFSYNSGILLTTFALFFPWHCVISIDIIAFAFGYNDGRIFLWFWVYLTFATKKWQSALQY